MKAILIFDGDCGICTFTSEFIKNRDKRDKLEVKPYQVLDLNKIHSELNEKLASQSVYLVDENNNLYNKSRAVFETLKRLSGVYKIIGLLLSNRFISFLLDPLYKLVARNRASISKLFGMNACKIADYQ